MVRGVVLEEVAGVGEGNDHVADVLTEEDHQMLGLFHKLVHHCASDLLNVSTVVTLAQQPFQCVLAVQQVP